MRIRIILFEMMEQNTNNKQLKLKIRSVTCLNDKTLLMRFNMPDETLQNLSYFRKTKNNLCIYLFIYLFIYLSIYLFIYLYIYLFIYLSISSF